MNDTLSVLEQAWKVCRDAYLQALFTLPKTTEEKEAAIKKVCEYRLLPPSAWIDHIFRDALKGKGDEVIWRDYWYEDKHRVHDLTEFLEYAQELCDEGGGKTKVVTGNDITMTYSEIVDVIFNYMVKNKVSGITNYW